MAKILRHRWKRFLGAGFVIISLAAGVEVVLSGDKSQRTMVQHSRNQSPVVTLLISTSSEPDTSRGTLPKTGDDSNETLTPWVQRAGRDIYRITFVGAELAMVAIAGDGTTNLDLYVFDGHRRLVCKATETNDRETCTWTPKETAEFFVEVRNHGSSPNQYRLWTN
jgi:hypothetical protein